MTILERMVFGVFSVLLTISVLFMLSDINDKFSKEIPVKGGSLTEGVIGFPRFINPLLAVSDADRDLSILIYSGLLRATPEGNLIEDLAESYQVSEDGLVYTFKIKDNALFHDGTQVTADDIVFTISKTQDNIIKSPKKAAWGGIAVQKIDNKTVQFILKFPYSPFLENTTLGILPKHVWENIDSEQFSFSQLNTNPIGSGPYKMKNTKRDSSGISEYSLLESFENYILGEPFLSEIKIKFFSNNEVLTEEFDSGNIESINTLPPVKAKEIKDKTHIKVYPLPRIFGLFFNQNQATIFADKSIRSALNKSVNRERIVNEVLENYGTLAFGPIPPGIATIKEAGVTNLDSSYYNFQKEVSIKDAISTLNSAGWEINEEGIMEKKGRILEFTISTSNIEELKKTAQLLREMWQNIGVKVNLQFFEPNNLNQDVIRPRKYDALLFGEIIGRDMDLYAFWHSSQRNDPGLNISLYANIKVDAILESIREEFNSEVLKEKYLNFEEKINEDIPAIFLYSPDFIYVIPEKIKGVKLGIVTTPAERFLNVYKWYINSEKIWNIFSNY